MLIYLPPTRFFGSGTSNGTSIDKLERPPAPDRVAARDQGDLRVPGTYEALAIVQVVMRWPWFLLALFGFAAGCGTTTGSHRAASCVEAIIVDGVTYARDSYNDARLGDEHLDREVGTVDGTYNCEEDGPASELDGIWGPSNLQGNEVWTVSGQPSESVLAVATGQGVQLYRSMAVPPLDSVIEGAITAIGINSEFDGETRFATIDDPATIEQLVAALGDARPADGSGTSGLRYFIEFEHHDDLVTVVPFWATTNRLGDRVVGDEWPAAIDRALAASPEGPTMEGLALEGASGTGTFHPVGACRHDRVDLEVTPGEWLIAPHEGSSETRWWLNPAQPAQSGSTASSQVGTTVVVPNFDGTVIVEVFHLGRDGDEPLEGCLTLGSDGLAPGSGAEGERLPTGTMDCRDTIEGGERESEFTATDHPSADATTFETPTEAVVDWQTDPVRVDSFGSARLTAVISEFASVVDLVSESGSVEGSLELSNNGSGWYVRSESLCPAP